MTRSRDEQLALEATRRVMEFTARLVPGPGTLAGREIGPPPPVEQDEWAVGATAPALAAAAAPSCGAMAQAVATLATKGEDSAREWVMYLQQNLAGRKGSTFAF